MKKFFAIAAAALAGATLLAFAGCDNASASRDDLIGGGLGGGAGTQAEAGARSAYALGAVTTAGLLAQSLDSAGALSPASQTQASGEGGTQTGTGETVKEEVGRFNEYFDLLNGFLDEGAFRSTVTENTDTSYDFAYKLTVEGRDAFGNETLYTMYYTETEAGVREEQDDDEHEVCIAYELTGVMEMDGVAYTMTGYRMSQTETERGEEETSESLWIMATDPENADNYVRMDLETESEQEGAENEAEREYVYSVYRDGRLSERTSVSFETEAEQNKTETEYELRIMKDGAVSRFEVERAERTNGTTRIGVRYQTEQGNGRFVVSRTAEGEYTYTFEDGSRLDFDDFDD